MRRAILILLLSGWALAVLGAEVIPPVPKQWFNDAAGVASADTAARLLHEPEVQP